MQPSPLSLYPLRRLSGVPSVTAAQMREADRLAVEDAGLDLLQILENAGRALALVVRDHLAGRPLANPDEGGRILVLAGRGNTGAAALAAVRHLRNWGLDPQVVLTGSPAHIGGAAARQLHPLRRDGLRFLWPGAPEFDAAFPDLLYHAAAVVDGIVGSGLRGPLQGDAALLVEAVLDRAPPAVISLDVPTGFDATTGEVASAGIVATATLTLALPKVGLCRGEASEAVGELLLADVGIPPYVFERLEIGGTRGLFADSPILRLLPDG